MPPVSKLNPYEDQIRRWRAEGKSFQEIVDLLSSLYGVLVLPPAVCKFCKSRGIKLRDLRFHPDLNLDSKPVVPGPEDAVELRRIVEEVSKVLDKLTLGSELKKGGDIADSQSLPTNKGSGLDKADESIEDILAKHPDDITSEDIEWALEEDREARKRKVLGDDYLEQRKKLQRNE